LSLVDQNGASDDTNAPEWDVSGTAGMSSLRVQHPGFWVRRDCLAVLGLSVTEAARVLGVTRQALNNLVNGKSGISPAMAIRLHKAFGHGAETWLQRQMDYDLALARKGAAKIAVKRVSRSRDASRPRAVSKHR
jgi:antitoxin HigA-1